MSFLDSAAEPALSVHAAICGHAGIGLAQGRRVAAYLGGLSDDAVLDWVRSCRTAAGAGSRGTLPPAASEAPHPGTAAPSGARTHLVVEMATGYHRELLARSVHAVIESDAAREAPVGAMILRDGDGGDRGLLLAERGANGWVLR